MPLLSRTLAVFAIPAVSAVFASLALAAPAAPALQDFKIVKECSQYAGTAPSYCTVIESNVAAIPKGTKIFYFGPDLGVADPVMTASATLIDAGTGNLATGYCIVDQRDTANQVGMCAFTAGGGTLAGFNAIIHVSEDAQQNFHWDGSYWTAK